MRVALAVVLRDAAACEDHWTAAGSTPTNEQKQSQT